MKMISRILSTDLETYSEVDIKTGLNKYTSCPFFEIRLQAYVYDDGPVVIRNLTREKLPAQVKNDLLDETILKTAYNAAFEVISLNAVGIGTERQQWLCIMEAACVSGFARGLKKTAESLSIDPEDNKIGEGTRLITMFCTPKGKQATQDTHPEHWARFEEYCIRDVEVERYIRKAIIVDKYGMSKDEQIISTLTFNMNKKGINIDMELVHGAVEIRDAYFKKLTDIVAQKIPGLNLLSNVQLKDFLTTQGVDVENVQKGTLEDLLNTELNPTVRELVEYRLTLSKTSLKKFNTLTKAVKLDGTISDTIAYYGGARTGRFAGRILQVQNLPKHQPENAKGVKTKEEELRYVEDIRDIVKTGKLHDLDWVVDDVADTLSGLIRSCIIPRKGNKLIVLDYSAIEARVLAWLANESWRIEVFEGHGKIYEASASQMFDVPIELISEGNPEYTLRHKGKIAELALGYGGGIHALKQFGADKMGLDDEALENIKQQWRFSNTNIVELWREVDKTAKRAITYEGKVFKVSKIAFKVTEIAGIKRLTCKLPSGRFLHYVDPKINKGKFGAEITYMNQENSNWVRVKTYGGKLVENITQAIARDCLVSTLLGWHKTNQKWNDYMIMHVHDELVLDIPEKDLPENAVNFFAKEMVSYMPWAKGLKLKVAGEIRDFYGK